MASTSSKTQTSTEKAGQHVNVCVRIRPFNSQEMEKRCTHSLEVLHKREILIKQTYNRKYTFDRVFDSRSTQEYVFDCVMNPLINEVLNGYNCTVFAYGQTGTGKTYTMVGQDNENAGIIPRSINRIFDLLKKFKNEYTVRVSFMELYNEELFDLLSISGDKAVRIYEDKNQRGSVIMQGLEEVTVTTKDEVYQILEMGSEKRRTATTLMNTSSSRSHTVFTIVVHTRDTTPTGEELVKTGKLYLVDLAGSENISKSGSVDKRAREAGSINQSLLTLGRVIKALTEKSTHIPYRESKLTRILQDSLGGRTKTSLIATVSSSHSNLEETISTLEYAMRARSIQNRPEVNQHMSRTALIRQYVDEIDRLKKDLHASRTGTGVYLNEENYNKLLDENFKQRQELVQKMTVVNELENHLEETSRKLVIVESSWSEAAINRETLTQEKTLLEEDLFLTKSEKEKQRKELEEYKAKHEQLATDTKKLRCTVEVQQETQQILHSKLSRLYDASYRNITTTEEFHNAFAKFHRGLVFRVNHCLDIVKEATSEVLGNSSHIKAKLDETYCALREIMFELHQVSIGISKFYANYVQTEETIEKQIIDNMQNLYQLVDRAVDEITAILTKTKGKHLGKIQGTMYLMTESHEHDYQRVTDCLLDILTSTSKFSQEVTELYSSSRASIATNSQAVNHLVDRQRRKCLAISSVALEVERDMTEKMNQIISQVEAVKTYYGLKLNEINTACEEAVGISFQLDERNGALTDDMFVVVDSAESLSREHISVVGHSVRRHTEIMNQLHQKDTEQFGTVTKHVNKISDIVEDGEHKTQSIFGEFTNTLAEHGSNIRRQAQAHRNCFDATNELCESLNDRTASANVLLNDVYSTINDINSGSGKRLEVANFDLRRLTNFFARSQAKAMELVDDFCAVKLKHPKHAGDTPQQTRSTGSVISNTDASSDGPCSSRLSDTSIKEEEPADFASFEEIEGIAPLPETDCSFEARESDSSS